MSKSLDDYTTDELIRLARTIKHGEASHFHMEGILVRVEESLDQLGKELRQRANEMTQRKGLPRNFTRDDLLEIRRLLLRDIEFLDARIDWVGKALNRIWAYKSYWNENMQRYEWRLKPSEREHVSSLTFKLNLVRDTLEVESKESKELLRQISLKL